jgi:hypothetical protein
MQQRMVRVYFSPADNFLNPRLNPGIEMTTNERKA